MLLRHLSIYLRTDAYPRELGVPFGFRTRCLCNFVERRLRKLGFRADGFNHLAIEGTPTPLADCPIVSENSALATVGFDSHQYEKLAPEEWHEFFISMLLEGMKKCSRHHELPVSEIEAAIDEFRQGGYRNEWVHQKKSLRSVGLVASLLCRMDPENFVLTLKLERGGEVVFEEPILKTLPDEIIFAHRFKEVVVEDETVVVRDKFGKPTFLIDVRPFVGG